MIQDSRFKIQKFKTIPYTLNAIRFKFGFTLIELLIVIAIIGVLAAGLLTIINPVLHINRAKDSQKLQGLSSIKNGLEIYYNLAKKYPTNLSDLTVDSVALKTLPGCTYMSTDCFIYKRSNDDTRQWAVTFVKLAVAKDLGASSKCSLEATSVVTSGGCLPGNYNPNNWACSVSGTVKCTDVKTFTLP